MRSRKKKGGATANPPPIYMILLKGGVNWVNLAVYICKSICNISREGFVIYQDYVD